MQALAERVVALTGSNSKIVYDREATDDPKRRCPDIALAKRELGWEPRVSLDEGLAKTIEYFRAAPRAERRVLVFSTTYVPDMGPAEEALRDLTHTMSETKFDIVTTAHKRGRPLHEEFDNVTVYRVGIGSRVDKYLLPVLGLAKGIALAREHRYVFVWSVMASYAGLTGALFRLIYPGTVFFVTLDDTEVAGKRPAHLSLVARLILKTSAGAYVSKLSQIGTSPLLKNLKTAVARGGDATSFARRVELAYADALNKRGHKLPRPR